MQQEKAGYLKSLKILHLALLAGKCFMLIVVLFLVLQKKIHAAAPALDKTLQVVDLLLSFAAVFAATSIFKKKINAINAGTENMDNKLLLYRSASLTQWVLSEMAALFSIICFFVTANYSFAALAVAVIIFYALQAPSRLKIMLQLQLSEQEADELQ